MEQYWMPKRLDSANLRLCIEHYTPIQLYIRDCGGIREDGRYHAQGMAKVDESLENRKLGFRKNRSGLRMLIDEIEVFHFPLKSYNKGFSMAYERRIIENGRERLVMLQTGIDPYDNSLPEPRKSTLRTVIDEHLMEIDIKGRVHLRFYSWWIKPHWKYWTVVKPTVSQA